MLTVGLRTQAWGRQLDILLAALRPSANARDAAEGGDRLGFESILFRTGGQGADVAARETNTDFYVDLHLEEVVTSIVAGYEEYDLAPFFHMSLGSVEEVAYRHAILRELESDGLRSHLEEFAEGMRLVRAELAQARRLSYPYQKAIWFVDAVRAYCLSVQTLREALEGLSLGAEGLLALRSYLAEQVSTSIFSDLEAESARLQEGLHAVRYRVEIRGRRLTVSHDEPGVDYSREIEETFRKFRQTDAKDYRVGFRSYPEMNHVEAEVLDQVARLNQSLFTALTAFARSRRDFLDPTLVRFDREVQVYLAYLAFVRRLRAAGLPFCYPEVCEDSKAVRAVDTFDLALADRLVGTGGAVVSNDFHLHGAERIFVVSGPNQGGKTTFARTFGQLHHLARLGLTVPGREARLLLCDRIFTLFARSEKVEDLRGRLQEELVRLRGILANATERSILIMNETFSSTTLQDARFLGREALRHVIGSDMLCVYVTFVDELSTFSEATVSMVSTVDPEDPAARTYKILRRPADGLAYAMAIAKKHRLTYDMLRDRLAR